MGTQTPRRKPTRRISAQAISNGKGDAFRHRLIREMFQKRELHQPQRGTEDVQGNSSSRSQLKPNAEVETTKSNRTGDFVLAAEQREKVAHGVICGVV